MRPSYQGYTGRWTYRPTDCGIQGLPCPITRGVLESKEGYRCYIFKGFIEMSSLAHRKAWTVSLHTFNCLRRWSFQCAGINASKRIYEKQCFEWQKCWGLLFHFKTGENDPETCSELPSKLMAELVWKDISLDSNPGFCPLHHLPLWAEHGFVLYRGPAGPLLLLSWLSNTARWQERRLWTNQVWSLSEK